VRNLYPISFLLTEGKHELKYFVAETGFEINTKRQVIDIPQTDFMVTEYSVFKKWCAACQKRVFPKLNLKNAVIGNHRFGLNTFTAIATLREKLRLPVNVIRIYFKLFYNLDLSGGEIVEILHKISSLSKPVHDKTASAVKLSGFICADETGFRENGVNGYLWNFTSMIFTKKQKPIPAQLKLCH